MPKTQITPGKFPDVKHEVYDDAEGRKTRKGRSIGRGRQHGRKKRSRRRK